MSGSKADPSEMIGVRVFVSDDSHPHYGETGIIVGPFKSGLGIPLNLHWTVENDQGERFAVGSREVRRVP